MPDTENPADPAAGRFWLLQVVRLGSMALVALGALAVAGKLDMPGEAGVVMIAAGLTAFFFFPPMLARKWRSGER